MIYTNICSGIFVKRPNRFIAIVSIESIAQVVHVRNTGRCKELLVPGATVILERSNNPVRKTLYTLIAVYKGQQLINMDSIVPNQVIYESLLAGEIEDIGPVTTARREATFGSSRFDIYFETSKSKGFIEIKGVTLEEDGVAMFPDAPTIRGTKHLAELMVATQEGYVAYVVFLIQMEGIREFRPNKATDPEFAAGLCQATAQGVRVLVYNSVVTPDGIRLGGKVELKLGKVELKLL
jgi:sugar fermentation stimulation protein A